MTNNDQQNIRISKLLNQWFLLVKVEVIIFNVRTVATMTWLSATEYLCQKWPRICFTCHKHFPVPSSFMTYHRVCSYIKMTAVTTGTGTAYPLAVPEIIPGFQWVRVAPSFVFCVVFCRSLFALLSFFVWPFCCTFPIYGF